MLLSVHVESEIFTLYGRKFKDIHDFHKHLYAYDLIPADAWSDFKDLRNIFHFMLTQKLATPEMFALFFKKIPLPSPEQYFSKNTAAEILRQISLLDKNEDPALLDGIYFIIQKNLLSFIRNKNIIPDAEAMADYLDEFFLLNPDIKLPALKNPPPSKNIAAFCKYHRDSLPLFRNLLSKNAFQSLIDSLDNPDIDIKDSIPVLEYAASLMPEPPPPRTARDWNMLFKSCKITDVLLYTDWMRIKNPPALYTAYKNGIIIFPEIKSTSKIDAVRRAENSLNYLKLLSLLD